MKRQFSDLFRKLDILAPEIKFNIGGESGVKTVLGGFLTIFYCLSVLVLTAYIMRTYFRTDIPMTMTQYYTREDTPAIRLAEHGMLPVLVPYRDSTTPLSADLWDSYFSLVVVRREWKRSIQDRNSQVEISFSDTEIETSPCSKLITTDAKYLFEFFKGNPLLQTLVTAYGICIKNPSLIEVVGDEWKDASSTFIVNIKPCRDKSKCVSAQESSKMKFQYLVPKSSLDHTDKDNPRREFLDIATTAQLNPYARQSISVVLQNNSVHDYVGIFPQWKQKLQWFDVKSVEEKTEARDAAVFGCEEQSFRNEIICPSFISFELKSSHHVFQVNRRYKNLIETFGEVGGVNEVLYIIFVLLYFRYNSLAKEELIVKKVFGFFDEVQERERRASKLLNFSVAEQQSQLGLCTKVKQKCKSCLFSILFCLKKKKTFDEVYKEGLKESALKNIQENMNVFNIIREMNNLKVICNFLFKSHHIKLIPFLEFNIFRRKEVEKMELYDNARKSRRGKIFSIDGHIRHQVDAASRFLVENSAKLVSYEHALDNLEKKVSKDQLSPGQGSLDDQIDKFFFETLHTTDEYLQKKTLLAEIAFEKKEKGGSMQITHKSNFGTGQQTQQELNMNRSSIVQVIGMGVDDSAANINLKLENQAAPQVSLQKRANLRSLLGFNFLRNQPGGSLEGNRIGRRKRSSLPTISLFPSKTSKEPQPALPEVQAESEHSNDSLNPRRKSSSSVIAIPPKPRHPSPKDLTLDSFKFPPEKPIAEEDEFESNPQQPSSIIEPSTEFVMKRKIVHSKVGKTGSFQRSGVGHAP